MPPVATLTTYKEEMMFAKYVLFILLTAGVVMLAASGTLPAAALAPEAKALSGGDNPDGSLAATSYLGGEIQISLPTTPECDRYKPSVAYNWAHGEYLVVWHNTWPDGHRDIYARRVSGSAELVLRLDRHQRPDTASGGLQCHQ
jgi:hypothetical protein